MRFSPAVSLFSPLLFVPMAIVAQQPSSAATDQLQPALVSLTQAVRLVRVDKWKAPGPVREDASRNLDSIERDLDGTLPGLIAATQTTPSMSANFAVYRNLEALYDVVLRVSLTAELAAPDVESEALDHALAQLESARKGLGETIAGSIEQQQQTIVQLQAASSRVAAPPPPPPTTTVVNDGPQPSTRTAAKAAKKKKAAAPPPQ